MIGFTVYTLTKTIGKPPKRVILHTVKTQEMPQKATLYQGLHCLLRKNDLQGLRLKEREFETHQRHFVVSLSVLVQDTLSSAYPLFQSRKTGERPDITKHIVHWEAKHLLRNKFITI